MILEPYVSAISDAQCKALGAPIYPLDSLLSNSDEFALYGSNGTKWPYSGYALLNVSVPALPNYVSQALFLVVSETPYRERIPVYLGLGLIDEMLEYVQTNCKDRALLRARVARKIVQCVNAVPQMLVSKSQSKDQQDREPIEIVLDKLDLGGLESVSSEQKESALALIEKYQHLFSTGSLDLGKTDLLKHKIKITDSSPFKERYRGSLLRCLNGLRLICKRCWIWAQFDVLIALGLVLLFWLRKRMVDFGSL